MIEKEQFVVSCPEDMKLRAVDREFYSRKTTEVAKDLLGKLLIRKFNDESIIGKIVEVEAYLGVHDPAAHAVVGRTKRTEVLFGEPGHAYIFSIHGYNCLNVVAEEVGSPGCILIRALEPVCGTDKMRTLRGKDMDDIHLTNGPGKLCRAFDIDLKLNGIDLASNQSPLKICYADKPDKFEVEATKRVGITKAADWELRFTVKNNKFVSKWKK